jgi:hypothetical protein
MTRTQHAYHRGRLHGSLVMALVLVVLFWVGVTWGRRKA